MATCALRLGISGFLMARSSFASWIPLKPRNRPRPSKSFKRVDGERPGYESRCSMARSDHFPSDALQEIMADLPGWLESSELAADGIRVASAPLSIWDVRAGRSL